MLWLTRGWGRASFGVTVSPPPSPSIARRASGHAPTIAPAPHGLVSLIEPPLGKRLQATEVALARAARDELGAPAAEWLTFWRRRVPDLITAAKGVFDDVDDTEKQAIAARLAGHLDGVIDEADRRLASVMAARRDLFTTRGAHADGRVRGG